MLCLFVSVLPREELVWMGSAPVDSSVGLEMMTQLKQAGCGACFLHYLLSSHHAGRGKTPTKRWREREKGNRE